MPSPSVIETMLLCYWSPDPAEEVGAYRWHSEATREALNWLRFHGLLDVCTATEKGRAWVDAICATPIPVQTWTIPERSKSNGQ